MNRDDKSDEQRGTKSHSNKQKTKITIDRKDYQTEATKSCGERRDAEVMCMMSRKSGWC